MYASNMYLRMKQKYYFIIENLSFHNFRRLETFIFN